MWSKNGKYPKKKRTLKHVQQIFTAQSSKSNKHNRWKDVSLIRLVKVSEPMCHVSPAPVLVPETHASRTPPGVHPHIRCGAEEQWAREHGSNIYIYI